MSTAPQLLQPVYLDPEAQELLLKLATLPRYQDKSAGAIVAALIVRRAVEMGVNP